MKHRRGLSGQSGVTAIELALVVLLITLVIGVAIPAALNQRSAGERAQASITLEAVDVEIRELLFQGGGVFLDDADPPQPLDDDDIDTALAELGTRGVQSGAGGTSSGPQDVRWRLTPPTAAGNATFTAVVAAGEGCIASKLVVEDPGAGSEAQRTRWAQTDNLDLDNDPETADAACDPDAFTAASITGRKSAPSQLATP